MEGVYPSSIGACVAAPPPPSDGDDWEAEYCEGEEEEEEEGEGEQEEPLHVREEEEDEEEEEEEEEEDQDDDDYEGGEQRRHKRVKGAPNKLALEMPAGLGHQIQSRGRIQMSLPMGMRASAARTSASQRRPVRSRSLFDGGPGGLQVCVYRVIVQRDSCSDPVHAST